MQRYLASISWERGDQPFIDNRYSRRHRLRFDGGVEVPASSSPHVVREPLSDPTAVDPEELFVAALSSCHMLWFLSIAAQAGFRVDDYVDHAEGVMARDASGRMAMTQVTLRPRVTCSGDRLPSPEEFERLHHQAHEECFIANSIRADVRCEPRLVV